MSVPTRHRRRRKSKPIVIRKASKYRTLVLGGVLILIGLGSVMVTLDYKPNLGSLLSFSNFKDWLNLWPFILTIVGFVFVIYDYLKHSSKQKYK